ncbi:MAG: hypothetical protein ABI557_04840 [Aureliella sp.]
MPRSYGPLGADELQELWSAAADIWDARQAEAAFDGYVSADFAAIHARLAALKDRAHTFLEWGSGLGVVAIMASRLGFDSYGIEVKPDLVEAARELAERFNAAPIFATGSFVPEEFSGNLREGDEFHRTETQDRSAYDELDMELRDFDLVYAYPWPEEHTIFRSIIRRCASPNTLYLRYDVREGLSLTRPARRQTR